MTRISVCVVLSLSAIAMAQDGGAVSFDAGVSMSARFPVAPVQYVPSTASNSSGMSVAAIGAESFALWSDDRDFFQGSLYGTRLGSSGQVLDLGGIAIGPYDGAFGTVAFGARYLAWSQVTGNKLQLYEVTPQNGLTSATPVSLTGIPTLFPVRVACAATVCAVAWVAFDGLYCVRFDSQLTALDSAPVKLGNGSASSGAVAAVASDGTDFLIAAGLSVALDGGTASSQLVSVQMTAAGTHSAYRPLPMTRGYGLVNLVGSNGRYLAVGSTGTPTQFFARRLDATGAAIDAAEFSVTPSNESSGYLPLVASTGTDFWLLWSQAAPSLGIKAVRMPVMGALGTPTAQFLSTTNIDRYLTRATGNATGLFLSIAVRGAVNTENVPTLNRFTTAGVDVDDAGIPVRWVPDTQDLPAVAWGGNTYLVVWQGNRSTPYLPQIHGRRFDAQGQPLSAPFRIGTSSVEQRQPAIAFDGTNFLVTWNERTLPKTSVHGARVTPAGTVLDTTSLSISPAATSAVNATVAFANGVYGVAWETDTNLISPGKDVRLQRLDPQGTVLDVTPIELKANPASDQVSPSIFSSGSQFLVLWRDSYLVGISPQLYGTRVSSSGAVLDATVLKLSARQTVGSTGLSDYSPSALWVNGEWMVQYNTENSYQVVTRIDADGGIHSPKTVISTGCLSDLGVTGATAFDGRRFHYIWNDSWFAGPSTCTSAWDTASDAGPQLTGRWRDNMENASIAQATPPTGLLAFNTPSGDSFPLIQRSWVRAVRFCEPGVTCSTPVIDAGIVDAGTFDAGVVDAGLDDVGAPDAGVVDAGPFDAGEPVMDAGVPDAGSDPVDAGIPGPEMPRGCGCQSSPSALLGVMLLALLMSRRGVRS